MEIGTPLDGIPASTKFGDNPPQTLPDCQTLVKNLPDKAKEKAAYLKQTAIQAVLSNPKSPLATLAKEIGEYIMQAFGEANKRNSEAQQALMLAHYHLALKHIEENPEENPSLTEAIKDILSKTITSTPQASLI